MAIDEFTTSSALGQGSDLPLRDHLSKEVIDHDVSLLSNGVLVALDICAQLLRGALRIELVVLVFISL
ncbi:hypothetical protein QJS66_21305 [Kocuria rhizophila]|nr:hypothetical protein QJS66_21305 [Kocuria rhizophila]